MNWGKQYFNYPQTTRVLEISHRVSVMRNGKLVGTLKIEDATEQLLAEMMVGRGNF